MLPVFSWPMGRVAKRYFDHIKSDDGELAAVRGAASEGSLVYVMRTRSVLDYLFFNHFLRKHGLPLARFANGVRTLFAAPLADQLRAAWVRFGQRRRGQLPLPDPIDSGHLGELVEGGHPTLLFMKHRAQVFGPGVNNTTDVVEVLVEAQRKTDKPIFVVPQVLVWERAPDRTHRGFWDVVLGDPESPSRGRKLALFLQHRKHAVARIGKPVNLQEFLAEHEGQPDARVAKKLRWMLLGFLYRERKVVKGPNIRPRRWLFDRILSEPAVRVAIEKEAATQGKPPEVIEKRARRILDRTGADFRMGVIMFMRWIMDQVVKRIYSGVEFGPEDAERIREASRKGTVLLLPTHRSHFDYLLLSWIVFYQGMVPPHIAAGINLSFFPMGPLFRRSGAFFIKRSFADDPLYKTLLDHYIRALTAEGYMQEFFIEGTRSRTGKMLPPKIGLLGTYVEAIADRVAPDIQIVPISIAYEKVVEEGAYRRELTGGAKPKESAGELVKGAGVLRRRFGRVYVRANRPISMKEALATLRTPYRELTVDDRKDFLKRFGAHILAEIQDVTVVTPSTVAATVLLTHDQLGITREVFLRRARFMTRFLEERSAQFSEAWSFPEDALFEAISMFAEAKLVEVVRGDERDQDVIAISQDSERRITLDYYKNNILFHFVPAAFVCTALVLGREDVEHETLAAARKRFDFLVRLFDQEFFFHPDVPQSHVLAEAGRLLQREGVVELTLGGHVTASGGLAPVQADGERPEPAERSPDELWGMSEEALAGDIHITVTDRPKSRLLIATLRNFFEAYYVVLEGASVIRREGPMPEKALVDTLLAAGQRMYLTSNIVRSEAVSKQNVTNAVRHFRAMGVLVGVDGSSDRAAPLALDEERHEDYARPLRALFHSKSLRPDDGALY
ncbi:MAG: 1-acyl-sn-glycerol-3-phosphate acyltransferase [Deltaproteobacteria bacterium]|nr:1-acyl-sn-glycerol-3-phosphate acyltransferase [Deltaproteobacteria bacterium]